MDAIERARREGRLVVHGPPLPEEKVSEDDFLREVIAVARNLGWKSAHFRSGLNKRGKWQTAVQGDGAGFPDLVLVRERVVWAELKTDEGTPSELQTAWQAWLTAAGQEAYLWRPRDWDQIKEVLGEGGGGG